MIDPGDPLDIQVVKQAKIIDALVRRTGRQHEVGHAAYSAFQSAIALQGQVWARLLAGTQLSSWERLPDR